MTDKAKNIQADIERSVAHLASVHGVTQEAIWNARRDARGYLE